MNLPRMNPSSRRSSFKAALIAAMLFAGAAYGQPATQPATLQASIVIRADQPKPISPDLFGIFFEDLNYAADGGIYAEMVRNRSFDFSATEQPDWNALTGWEFANRNGARGSMFLQDVDPVHPNNPTYLMLNSMPANGDGSGSAIINSGYDGIAIKAGERYSFSVFARARPNQNITLQVRLEGADGTLYASETVQANTPKWSRLSATLSPTKDDPKARLVILNTSRGAVMLDMISLFPAKTFRDRPNGLRADLAQAIADLKPRFVRFPGGCLAHGDGIRNIYNWKDTIGPVEQRKGAKNIWRYHQTMGLGYFEYFQFCQDIGATPLPVVAAGVSCQNSDHTPGIGQQCIPMDQMPAYVQDVLDLIEYANGPASSAWGAKRAAAGHPEPFKLRYLGIGNEDAITPEFRERFKMLFDAVKAKYPDITVIGTVGPAPGGRDFDQGWKIARELSIPMVDEHYYQPPNWFLSNTKRYDSYDRKQSKVYLGEYASRGNALSNALAEAAYMTALERNGDVVQLASYAPLLCKQNHVQWYPDLIFFNNSEVFPSVNYYVQQLFGHHAGETYLPSTITPEESPLSMSTVRDSKSGDLIIKLVNATDNPVNASLTLEGAQPLDPEGLAVTLTGNPRSVNPGDPRGRENVSAEPLTPRNAPFKADKTIEYAVPAHSLTVLRMKPAK